MFNIMKSFDQAIGAQGPCELFVWVEEERPLKPTKENLRAANEWTKVYLSVISNQQFI